MDSSITKYPATLLGKLDNSTFGIQEEEVFGAGDGKGGIGLLGAVCDLAADGADENLQKLLAIGGQVLAAVLLTFENNPKSSEGTRSDFVSRHTLS